MPIWPDWWEWELEITAYLEKRMLDREFSEVDLGSVLEKATRYKPDVVEGRWVIHTKHNRRKWEVIVEPDGEEELLVVVTACLNEVNMKDRYLEVTFRKGKPIAAYLYLPRDPGEKSQRTEKAGNGILIDYGKAGRPIGIEITAPDHVSLSVLNDVLARLNVRSLEASELAPLLAA